MGGPTDDVGGKWNADDETEHQRCRPDIVDGRPPDPSNERISCIGKEADDDDADAALHKEERGDPAALGGDGGQSVVNISYDGNAGEAPGGHGDAEKPPAFGVTIFVETTEVAEGVGEDRKIMLHGKLPPTQKDTPVEKERFQCEIEAERWGAELTLEDGLKGGHGKSWDVLVRF